MTAGGMEEGEVCEGEPEALWSEVRRRWEDVLQSHARVQVVWSQYCDEVQALPLPSARRSALLTDVLRRAVKAVPHSPQLRLRLLVSLARDPEANVLAEAQEAMAHAGDQPAAFSLWQFVLQLLRMTRVEEGESGRENREGSGCIPTALAAYRCLLSIPAPAKCRCLVQQDADELTSSLTLKGLQLCSSLPGVPPCATDHPALVALLDDMEIKLPLSEESLISMKKLTGTVVTSGNCSVDEAAVVWQRREYFENYLSAYLEQDVAYHANLRLISDSSNVSVNNSGGTKFSCSKCYRVVSSNELDIWHGYIDFESNALLGQNGKEMLEEVDVKSTTTIDICDGNPFTGNYKGWINLTFSCSSSQKCKQSLLRLYERALAADACLLYPEIWRRYVFWVMNSGVILRTNENYRNHGVSAAFQVLREVLSTLPMSRFQSLRTLYASLLEYSGLIDDAREVHHQLLYPFTFAKASDSTIQEDMETCHNNHDASKILTQDLEVITTTMAFECRQLCFDKCHGILRDAFNSEKIDMNKSLRNAMRMLQLQVIQAQQCHEGQGWKVSAVQEGLQCLCEITKKCRKRKLDSKFDGGTDTSAEVDLSSLFRDEADFPIAKSSYDLLLRLPPSEDRDSKVWQLLSNALMTATYGVRGNVILCHCL